MELTILVVPAIALVVLVVVWTSIAWQLRQREHERKAEELKNRQLLELLKAEYKDKLNGQQSG